ncbi:hypothetical protein MF4836_01140 [Pseudomonas sp. MF4836]|nr:hypothetical protein MF4836_01140 [Pseudomonas sp. MF4836]
MSLRTAGAAICLALVAVAVWGAYKHGRSTMDEEWQNRWAARDAGDKQAWALAEVAEREKEQAFQRSITKAAEDGQRRNDEAFAAGAAVRADRGVRDEADRTASSTASQARSHSCTAAASEAASRAVLVLADVFKRADERAGDLAADADQSRSRGVTCEQAYDGVVKAAHRAPL